MLEKRKYDSQVREELRHWPYTIHKIDDTLDAALIEGRGKQLLFQSLNSKMLTAFVGSGVSAAYGRMSWTEWRDAQVEEVNTVSEKFLVLSERSIELKSSLINRLEQYQQNNPAPENESYRSLVLASRWLEYRRQVVLQAEREVKNLRATFSATSSKSGSFPGGEGLPVMFEIAKKLHDLTLSHRRLFLTGEPGDKPDEKAEAFTGMYGSVVDDNDGAPEKDLEHVMRTYLAGVHDAKFHNAYKQYCKVANRVEATISFESLAKSLLIDEISHAQSLLTKALAYHWKNGRFVAGSAQRATAQLDDLVAVDTKALKRDIDGIRDAPSRFRVLNAFRLDQIQSLINRGVEGEVKFPKMAKDVLNTLSALYDEYLDDSREAAIGTGRVFLTPTTRFLVPFVWQLLEDPVVEIGSDVFDKIKQPLEKTDFRGRRSIIASRLDPLAKLSGKLNVSRYLTTNYDFEIERMYQDRGYRTFSSLTSSEKPRNSAENSQSFRTDGIGGVMRDLTFSASHATDLLSFAAGGTGADANIFHLHGRATADDEIVITERDYMDMYLRDDSNRELVDESILMAFAATPILFLGLGMEESDLLRPLRQFISNKDRLIGYKSIVLMDGTKSYDGRAKMAAGLYTRYGAHTIFFGSGLVEIEHREPEDPDVTQVSIDWLHRICQLISQVRDDTSKRIDAIQKDLAEILTTHQLDCDEEFDRSGKEWNILGQLESNGALKEIHQKLAQPVVTLDALQAYAGKLGADLDVNDPIFRGESALAVMLGMTPAYFEKQFRNADGKLEYSFESHREILQVRNCIFTSHRDLDNADERNVKLSGVPYCGFYVRLLNDLLTLSLRRFEVDSVAEGLRLLNALLHGLDGLSGAMRTASLCASLDALEREWRNWWTAWQEIPPVREAKFETIIGDNRRDRIGQLSDPSVKNPIGEDELQRRLQINLPARYIRHRVESVITDLSTCRHMTAGTPDIQDGVPHAFEEKFLTRVRVFDTFIYDVAEVSREEPVYVGRRVQTIAASRGQGKGVFFSTFSTRLGLSSYISAAHFNGRNNTSAVQPIFFSSIFINLSFAPEVASIYEMTSDCLNRTVSLLEILCGKTFADHSNDRQLDELNLHFRLETLPEQSRRILLYMLTTGEQHPVLLTKHGKSDHQYRHLDDIASAIRQAAEQHYSHRVTLNEGKARLSVLKTLFLQFRLLASHFRRQNILGISGRPRLLLCANAIELLFDERKRFKNYEIATVVQMFASPVTASVPIDLVFVGSIDRVGSFFSNDNLLSRKFHIGKNASSDETEKFHNRKNRLRDRKKRTGPKSVRRTNYVHSSYQLEPIDFLVDNFPALGLALLVNRVSNTRPGQSITWEALNTGAKDAYRVMQQVRDDLWVQMDPPNVNSKYHHSRKDMVTRISALFIATEIDDELRDRFKIPAPKSDAKNIRYLTNTYNSVDGQRVDNDVRDWRELRQALRGNRFCLTILMAAAEFLVFNEQKFSDGGATADDFLRNTVSHLLNASASRREEIVLRTTMRVYEESSIIGDARYDHELHLRILRNISVLGCPVSPNVIVRLPDIRDYFKTIQVEGKLSRRRIIAKALAVLSERGLVFRLRPHPKLIKLEQGMKAARDDNGVVPEDNEYKPYENIFRKWPAELEYRYALHRLLQTYCFRRLGHLSATPVSANIFCPTLYSSMPSRVVRLSHEGYVFLRRLLLGLSQYPDIRHVDSAREMPIFTDDDVVTRVQALRAAMSLVRTSLSIAAVSRFDDKSSVFEFSRKRGHFETYKVRLRWILRKAWEVHNPIYQNGKARPELHTQINALYIDEIVWLYNEIAVICLVQGNLLDGIGHARQAININRTIEGDFNNGPTHNMLALNLAIMQIERGRLTSADRRLTEIITNERVIKRRVYWLAKGYKALIAQLNGRLKEAEAGFSKVIANLQRDKEIRALAVMIHHQGRLMALSNVSGAKALLRRARDYAETGGHEDIRHRIIVSEVWLSQHYEQDPLSRVSEDRIKLREVEQYARAMDLSSLLVESLHQQGAMLLSVGDTIGSGRILTRAMAVARRNDMTLRLNSLLTNYSKVLIERRRITSAQRLLATSMAMAKRSGYSPEVVRIHELMETADKLTAAN